MISWNEIIKFHLAFIFPSQPSTKVVLSSVLPERVVTGHGRACNGFRGRCIADDLTTDKSNYRSHNPTSVSHTESCSGS